MPIVTLYTTERCSRCASAKRLLAQRGIPYKVVDLAKDPDGRAELQRRTGMLTFPQIVIGDQTLGGYEQLLAADRAGRLAELVAH
jgi:glutaredoxin 3